MVILKYAEDVTEYISGLNKQSLSIGFVPTMGALHEGHIFLIEESRKWCDKTVCSIFINPVQFNNPEDFKKYPVTMEKDIYLLEKHGCDVLFIPEVKEMYPDGMTTSEHFDLGYLETILEGEFRPGHFQGVCRVVKRLLEIVLPTHLFLGQKDYQQSMVIKKLLEMIDSPAELIICSTLRQPDGLALSSRNTRLSEDEKKQATEIYKTLKFFKQNIKPGRLEDIKKAASDYLTSKGFKTDYVEIADAKNLVVMNNWDGTTKLVALAAAFINDIRLIDNILLSD